jgi:hypothetical protein
MLLAAVAGPQLAIAQTSGQVGTYVAIARTPIGALAPMLTSTLISRAQNGASLALRYGNLGSGDLNPTSHGFGLSAILPAGLGSGLRLTGGVLVAEEQSTLLGDIEDRAELMLSIGGDLRLVSSRFGTAATSPVWTVSLDGELGYGNRDPGSHIAGTVGLPVALVQRGSGVRFVPFITPGFVFARTSVNGTSSSGSGLMVGGGLGIYNMDTDITLNVGIQHQFVRGGRSLIGINLLGGGK